MKVKVLVAIVGLLVILTAILVALLDVEAPDLGSTVLENVGKAVGLRLNASRFKWNLTKGLVAEDVEASSSFPGGRLTVQVDQILFEHQLLPLIAGKVVIRRFTMSRPRGKIVKVRVAAGRGTPKTTEGEDGSAGPGPSKTASKVDLFLVVSEFSIEDGALITQGFRSGQGGVSLDGLDLVFRDLRFQPGAITVLHGLVSEAEVNARNIDVGSILVRNMRGRMRFDRGNITLPDLEYSTSNGIFKARFAVDFNQIPFGYELSLEGDPFEIGPLIGSIEKLPGTLTLDARGFGTDIRNTSGQGVFHLRGGVLPGFPIVTEVEKSLRREGLAGSSFEPVGIPFEVKDGQLVVQPFELRNQRAALTIGGSVHFDGTLSLNVTVNAVDGNDSSYLRVSGTVDQPIVEVVTSYQSN